jgi:hypothetical protein
MKHIDGMQAANFDDGQFIFVGMASFVAMIGVCLWVDATWGPVGFLPTFLVCFFLLAYGGVFYSKRFRDRRREAERVYRAYLEGFDIDALMCASTSPELDSMSREIIVGFLNEHYPGWSFGARSKAEEKEIPGTGTPQAT